MLRVGSVHEIWVLVRCVAVTGGGIGVRAGLCGGGSSVEVVVDAWIGVDSACFPECVMENVLESVLYQFVGRRLEGGSDGVGRASERVCHIGVEECATGTVEGFVALGDPAAKGANGGENVVGERA